MDVATAGLKLITVRPPESRHSCFRILVHSEQTYNIATTLLIGNLFGDVTRQTVDNVLWWLHNAVRSCFSSSTRRPFPAIGKLNPYNSFELALLRRECTGVCVCPCDRKFRYHTEQSVTVGEASSADEDPLLQGSCL